MPFVATEMRKKTAGYAKADEKLKLRIAGFIVRLKSFADRESPGKCRYDYIKEGVAPAKPLCGGKRTGCGGMWEKSGKPAYKSYACGENAD